MSKKKVGKKFLMMVAAVDYDAAVKLSKMTTDNQPAEVNFDPDVHNGLGALMMWAATKERHEYWMQVEMRLHKRFGDYRNDL